LSAAAFGALLAVPQGVVRQSLQTTSHQCRS